MWLPVRHWTDVDVSGQSVTFHTGSCVHCVPKQTVTGHLVTHHPCHHRPCVQPYTNLTTKYTYKCIKL